LWFEIVLHSFEDLFYLWWFLLLFLILLLLLLSNLFVILFTLALLPLLHPILTDNNNKFLPIKIFNKTFKLNCRHILSRLAQNMINNHLRCGTNQSNIWHLILRNNKTTKLFHINVQVYIIKWVFLDVIYYLVSCSNLGLIFAIYQIVYWSNILDELFLLFVNFCILLDELFVLLDDYYVV